MSLSVTTQRPTMAAMPAKLGAPPPAMRDAFVDLGKALRSGDADAAKSAYRQMVQAAPDGATLPKGSPFAQLGKALIQGDMDAAKSAYASMIRAHAGGPATPQPMPGPVPASPPAAVPSATGGTVGTALNLVA